jgi:predicted helicase
MNDLSQAIKAKIVDKCGTRDYWENWATDIAKIAQAHITRINAIVLNSGTPEHTAFLSFLEEIRDDLNPEISESDAVEMLAQHLITKPVFDTLFQGNEFTAENAVSKAMETVLEKLYQNNIDTESGTLNKFYESVKRRAAAIITSNGRQKLILELYDRFFRNAFPAMTRKLGIVYTPIEVVDFIIHSVNNILQDEFGKTLGSKNVHILDPFTGTGTFITRLMESGFIETEDLAYKYKNEIHANEIVLLAYYIAAINIESVYQDLVKENRYQPFNGMVLTDTFQLFEQEHDMIADLLPDNSNRRTAQKKRKIMVVISNPPYSVGQKSANENAANTTYPNLDERIRTTYVADAKTSYKKSIYDSYIRAFRWASDRVEEEGVVGFVSGAAWIDRSFADGIRKHLKDDFSKIYVFHLRGDIRKNMLSSGAAGEGENIFGQGSMTGICITILVRKKSAKTHKIFFYEIGKGLKRNQKLATVKYFGSINGITSENKWTVIEPDENNDWINQGEKKFNGFISLGDKKNKSAKAIFNIYSSGLITNRDAWCFNMSNIKLVDNISRSIDFYNSQLNLFKNEKQNGRTGEVKDFIKKDPKLFSWDQKTIKSFELKRSIKFNSKATELSVYRPFMRQWVYRDKSLFWSEYLQSKIFPTAQTLNLAIAITGVGGRSGFSCLMINVFPSRDFIEKTQCFPLKIYKKDEGESLFGNKSGDDEYIESDGISDAGLKHFSDNYPGDKFNKEDLFYYVYGLLHSPAYREMFKNNLTKELPRIPAVKIFEDFMAFSRAGRKLGDLHVNYESVEPYPVLLKEGSLILPHISDPQAFFRVEKMKYAKKQDKTTVNYNKNLTMQNIPLEAYEYVVNGKSALDWVIERQCVKTDRASGIVNDANSYANETMNNPAYPFELFQRVITVSLETMKIIRSLPKLDID